MEAIWSEESKLARWLEVELAATDAWAELGVVPAEAAEQLRSSAIPPSPERVAEIEAFTHHDVAAFVDAVAEQVGPSARWLHFGLTSSDVLDTALALQVREAGALVLSGVDDALAAVIRRANEHRATPMVGRTHGVHAEPITFGAKLAGWAFELDRGRDRLARAVEGMRIGKLSGTVGVYAGGEPEVERIVCEQLGLEREPVATQVIPRDRHAELLGALAMLAASLDRFATELRHLARTEVREVMEPFGRGQKGSSAMPHKRNPVVAERISGLARVVRANALVGLENVVLWHERDISHSSAERVILPDSFLAIDYMLDRLTWLVDGLVVDPARMRRNLDASHGLVFSQRVLLALIESGLSRDDAYRLVQRHALRAWEEDQDFRQLCEGDPEIAARLDADGIARAFDLSEVLQHVDVLFERLAALAARGEPITCLKPQCMSQAGRFARSSNSTKSGCSSWLVTGSRSSTSSSQPTSPTRVACSLDYPASGSRARASSWRITCSSSARMGGRPKCRNSRCFPSSASSAATSPARAGRTTSGRGRHRATSCLRAPGVRSTPRADFHPGYEGPDRPRREHFPRGRGARRRRRPVQRGRATVDRSL